MKSGIFFMESREQENARKHVTQKIRRISMALDKRDYWNIFMLAGMLGVALGSLLYSLF
jgi:hypothetical protein